MSRRLGLLLLVAAAAAVLLAGVLTGTGAGPSSPGPPSTVTPTAPPATGDRTGGGCRAGARDRLSVLTLNIHFGRTAQRELGLARLAREIRAWDPDVVLLQEVDRRRARSRFVDEAGWLGRRLGMAARFGGNRRVGPGWSGNAVLTRLPVLASRNRPLPQLTGQYPRGLLRTRVRYAGRALDVFVTHLDQGQPMVRRAQARVVAGVVRRTDRPVVLGGDLNSTPAALPPEILARAGLVDTWSAVGRGPGLTAPAADPRRRIDHLFSDHALVPVHAEVVLSMVSDHRGVLADYQLRPGCG